MIVVIAEKVVDQRYFGCLAGLGGCLLLLKKHRALKCSLGKPQKQNNKIPNKILQTKDQPHHRRRKHSTSDVCKHYVSTSGVSRWRRSSCLHGFCVGWGAQAGGKVMLRQSCSKSLLTRPGLSGRPWLVGDCLRWPAYELLPPASKWLNTLDN